MKTLLALLVLTGACTPTAEARNTCKLDWCGDARGTPVLNCYCKIVDKRNECFSTKKECDSVHDTQVRARRARVAPKPKE